MTPHRSPEQDGSDYINFFRKKEERVKENHLFVELELRVRRQSGLLKEHGHQVRERPLDLRVVVSGVVDLPVDWVVVFEKEQNLAILLERRQSRLSGIGRKQLQEARPRVAAVGHLGHRLPVVRLPVERLGAHRVVGAAGHGPDAELVDPVADRQRDQLGQLLESPRFADAQVHRHARLWVVQVEPLMTCQPKKTEQKKKQTNKQN